MVMTMVTVGIICSGTSNEPDVDGKMMVSVWIVLMVV
jgi:hypothetical protein